MRFALPLLLAFSILAVASCKSTSPRETVSAKTAGTPPAAPKPPPAADEERTGVFVPASSAALSIWPEAYSSELVVVEVLPQGSVVREDDVVARVDTRSVDDQIHAAELEARSAAIRHQGVVERNRIDEDAAAAALEQSRASLERARRSLEGWTTHEVPFDHRGEDISKKWQDAGIEDQKDELSQLEKMYSADELVDATEEIVMKRAKRQLGISEESRGLSGDRRQYRVEYDEAMQTQVKEEGVRTQEQALDRLVRGQAIEKRAREDALSRSADALEQQNLRLERLKRDREKLILKAPRAGVLLHGKEKDYRPGRTPARHERGGQLSFRTDLFLVADPDSAGVALDVPESVLKKVIEGSVVSVRPIASPETSATGSIRFDPYPAARSSGGEEATYEATVDLEHAIPGVLFGMRAKVKLGAGAEAPDSPGPAGPSTPGAGAPSTPGAGR